jgi:hypothetical protein
MTIAVTTTIAETAKIDNLRMIFLLPRGDHYVTAVVLPSSANPLKNRSTAKSAVMGGEIVGVVGRPDENISSCSEVGRWHLIRSNAKIRGVNELTQLNSIGSTIRRWIRI